MSTSDLWREFRAGLFLISRSAGNLLICLNSQGLETHYFQIIIFAIPLNASDGTDMTLLTFKGALSDF